MARTKIEGRARRKLRIRKKVEGTAERPRLTVFRSNKQIYAQVIDDRSGATIVAASSVGKDAAKPAADTEEKGKRSVAEAVGQVVASACLAKGISQVVFDRNGYIYHGRVKALADGARKGGLSF
jgi:large subunit ribosomal protein L18